MAVANKILQTQEAPADSASLSADASTSLKAIRKYQRDRRSHGVNRVRLYFKDVEGDWLEQFCNQGTEDSTQD
jgi:hypothetical protein